MLGELKYGSFEEVGLVWDTRSISALFLSKKKCSPLLSLRERRVWHRHRTSRHHGEGGPRGADYKRRPRLLAATRLVLAGQTLFAALCGEFAVRCPYRVARCCRVFIHQREAAHADASRSVAGALDAHNVPVVNAFS